MSVRLDGAFFGSIGGGALEWNMLAEAARLLARHTPAAKRIRQALGPDLGQCCGGSVEVVIEIFNTDDLPWIAALSEAESGLCQLSTSGETDHFGRIIRRVSGPQAGPGQMEVFGVKPTPLLLFGAGHVGRALVLALAPLPFRVTWIDPREDAFPQLTPGNVSCRRLDDPVAALSDASDGSFALVLTHSHKLDLAIVARALPDNRFPYVGLIGSATKRARFVSQMSKAGFPKPVIDRLVCPIGGSNVRDKEPAVIAAMTSAELLVARDKRGKAR